MNTFYCEYNCVYCVLSTGEKGRSYIKKNFTVDQLLSACDVAEKCAMLGFKIEQERLKAKKNA